jgi:Fic family protein
MSAQIKKEHKDYYDILESTQNEAMDVTPWMEWFLGCLGRAIGGAQETLRTVLDKARFWDRIKDAQINERQKMVINRLLDGFEGKLTSSKYAMLAKCSQDTAHRDILALVAQDVLVQNPAGGRSTSYSLTARDGARAKSNDLARQ